MMFKFVFHGACFLGLALGLASGAEPPVASPGVRVETFAGWENSLALGGGDARAMIVPAVGGRIAQYALNGDNIIYDEPGSGGLTLAGTPAGFAVGGYQCDLGPELRGLPDHKLLWLGAYQWTSPRPHCVALHSVPDPGLGIQMEKEITVDPDTGELGLVQRMKNVASSETAFCCWDRTLCKAGGFALLPLNKKSRFKSGWAIRKEVDGKFVYDGEKPADPRVRVLGGILVVEAKGPLLKLGADSDGGWIAYTTGRLLFIKFFPCFPKAPYTDGGNSVEFFCDEKAVGLEPLSPEAKLKPGESYAFPEKWVLIDLDTRAATFADARALVKRVPASPFKK